MAILRTLCMAALIPLVGLVAPPWLTTVTAYSARDASLFFIAYAALAVAGVALGCVVQRSRLALATVALLLSAAVAFHVRSTLHVPDAHASVAVLVLLLAGCHYAVLRWAARGVTARRGALVLVGAVAAFICSAVLPFYQFPTFRWHLLRHQRLLSVSFYYALAPSTEQVNAELWKRRSKGVGQVTATAPTAALAAGATPPPDIVVVLIDTLRGDVLSAPDAPKALMPNLDRVARESTVFTDVQANATWTRASVASMFTGLHAEQHGAVDRGDAIRGDVPVLAEELGRLGYRTAAFVTNFGAISPGAGFARGFDTFERVAVKGQPYAYAADVNAATDAWLARRGSDRRPLFLYVHYLDPHVPYMHGEPRSSLGSDLRVAYDAELRYFDGHLPALQAMIRTRIGPDTVVVFTSDHGEEFGEHGEYGHGTALTPEQARILLMVQHPRAAPARLAERLEGRDVRSLVHAIAGGASDFRGWAKAQAHSERYLSLSLTTKTVPTEPHVRFVAMRGLDDGSRFLIWSAYGPTHELYDLRDDPERRNNVIERQPDWARELTPALDRAMEASSSTRSRAQMDAKSVEQLRSLGYAE